MGYNHYSLKKGDQAAKFDKSDTHKKGAKFHKLHSHKKGSARFECDKYDTHKKGSALPVLRTFHSLKKGSATSRTLGSYGSETEAKR